MIITILVAMLLSTASARTLKDSDHDMDCNNLNICVYDELLGNKTLATINIQHKGSVHKFWGDVGSGVSCITFCNFNDDGPDVDIQFYLDKVLVHKGHYQQNYCFWMAGAITTNDPNAVTLEGSYRDDRPGYVYIKAW